MFERDHSRFRHSGSGGRRIYRHFRRAFCAGRQACCTSIGVLVFAAVVSTVNNATAQNFLHGINLYNRAEYDSLIFDYVPQFLQSSLGEEEGLAHYFLAESYYNKALADRDGVRVRDLLRRARQAFQRAISSYPAYAEANYMLGLSLYQQQQFEAATKAARQAVKAYPRYEEAHFLLATLAKRRGDWPEAVQAYRQVMKLNPKNVEALFRLAFALEQTGQPADAKLVYQQVVDQEPQRTEALLRFAVLAEQQHNPQEAVKAYRAFLKRQPEHTEALYRLAMLYDTQGDIEQAIAAYSHLLILNPQHTDAALYLAFRVLGKKFRFINTLVYCTVNMYARAPYTAKPTLLWTHATRAHVPDIDENFVRGLFNGWSDHLSRLTGEDIEQIEVDDPMVIERIRYIK